MKTLELYDPWAAAYAVATGVELITVNPDTWPKFLMDDANGQASRALGQWRSGKAMVNAKALASAYRHIKQVQHSAVTTAQDKGVDQIGSTSL